MVEQSTILYAPHIVARDTYPDLRDDFNVCLCTINKNRLITVYFC